jgi:predicted DCC family thiol-disulfide oxidoreductase YuxK
MTDSCAQGPPHAEAAHLLYDGAWKAAVIARILPTALLDRAYNAIARNRHRVFGRFDRCLAPRPEFRGRFIE